MYSEAGFGFDSRRTRYLTVVGILLEIVAAGLGTTSKQLIAYSEHVKKRWIFHLGASINIFVGPIVDASAYAFAPQVVVAPFACLDVIFNALTAPYTLRWQNEQLSKVHLLGTSLVAVGAAFTAIFGAVHDQVLTVYEFEDRLLAPESLVYMGAELVLITVAHIALKARLLSATTRGIALGTVAGVLMGNVFFLKGFVTMVETALATGDIEAWQRPTPYICLVCAAAGAILGHIFMRHGLGEYKGVFMVTIFEGAHITAACLSGCVVMNEMAHAPWWRYCLYWLAVATLVSGMVVINTAAKESAISEPTKKTTSNFHIAQSFADDELHTARKAPIGRPLTDGPGLDDEVLECFPVEPSTSSGDAELEEVDPTGDDLAFFLEEPAMQTGVKQRDGARTPKLTSSAKRVCVADVV